MTSTLNIVKSIGRLTLRDRAFEVRLAEIKRLGENWCVEIETHDKEFDGESWAPYLYHQGLHLSAKNAVELQGQATSWKDEADDPHPEEGTMYVFGHHDVRNCRIVFGNIADGRIQLRWEGLCDVFWDANFEQDVPFVCDCLGLVDDA